MILQPHEPPNRFFAAFNRWFDRVTMRYRDGVVFMLRRGILAAVLFLGMVALTVGLGASPRAAWSPTKIRASTSAPSSSRTAPRSSERSRSCSRSRPQSAQSKQQDNSFTGFDFIGGGFRNNAATIFVTQKPWDEG
jgi:multidrug efflux pump subunit AcrB